MMQVAQAQCQAAVAHERLQHMQREVELISEGADKRSQSVATELQHLQTRLQAALTKQQVHIAALTWGQQDAHRVAVFKHLCP